jgi:hypothetical protein
VVLDAAIIAALANAINLLDLRPGRALKAAALPAALLAASGGAGAPIAAAALGAGAMAVPRDLAEQTMLGDCGAAALGAAIGFAATRQLPVPHKVGVLAALVALTLVSERVSFSRVIRDHPLLSRLDAWGRRP